MSNTPSIFKTPKKIIFNIFLLLLLFYFIFHSIYGNRGIIAYFKLNQKLATAFEELEDLRSERIELEHRVQLLKPSSLDKDMLEEQARSVLGIALPKEQVFTPGNKDN